MAKYREFNKIINRIVIHKTSYFLTKLKNAFTFTLVRGYNLNKEERILHDG